MLASPAPFQIYDRPFRGSFLLFREFNYTFVKLWGCRSPSFPPNLFTAAGQRCGAPTLFDTGVALPACAQSNTGQYCFAPCMCAKQYGQRHPTSRAEIGNWPGGQPKPVRCCSIKKHYFLSNFITDLYGILCVPTAQSCDRAVLALCRNVCINRTSQTYNRREDLQCTALD